jgi:hypothetical protein
MLRAAAFLVSVVLFLAPVRALAQCAPPLDPLDDGSGVFGAVGLPPIVISEINPGDYIEFFNTTAGVVNMNAYWLCSPFVYAQVAGTVPAGGYATFPWPAIFTDTNAGGEIQLYKSGNFGNSVDILDFVCWGVNPHGSRVGQAIAVGKWSGGCAPALAGGAIHRKVGTKGTLAADYDVTSAPSPMNCVPSTSGVGGSPAHPSIQLSVGPNPFAAIATIEFSLSAAARVEVSVFAVDGSRVARLETADYPAGTNRVLWDGTDDRGRRLPSGVYLVRLSTGAASVATRLTILR